MTCPERTAELGIDTTSFLGVHSRVTRNVFSTTSPTVSPTLIRSPSWNERVYVSTVPATTLAMAVLDPIENRMPMRTVRPWKAALSASGV